MPKKAILHLHVSRETKQWLKKLCKQQVGHVSQSTMAEQLFTAAQRLGIFARGKERKTKNKAA